MSTFHKDPETEIDTDQVYEALKEGNVITEREFEALMSTMRCYDSSDPFYQQLRKESVVL